MKREPMHIAVLILTGLVATPDLSAQSDAPKPVKPAEPTKPADGARPANTPNPEKLAPRESVSDDEQKAPARKLEVRTLGNEGGQSDRPTPALTAEHKIYEMLVGEWKGAVSYHGMRGGAPPATRGKFKFESILGGRFLMETAQTDVANPGFEWVGIYGYNPKSKKYSAVWVDNESDNNDTATGTYDDALKTFTFNGEQDNPLGTGKSQFKWTIRFHPPVELTVEMFEPGADGKDKLVMRFAGNKQ